jgi:hypothetical protein
MKWITYIVLLTIAGSSCNRQNEKVDHLSVDTLYNSKSKRENFNPESSVTQIDQTTAIETGVTIPADSLFTSLESELKEIGRDDFEEYNKNYKINCTVGPGGFISGLGLSVEDECDEICQAYIVEHKSGEKMLLPCNYDAGILGLLMAPGCNRFIIYSSYDGPDYVNYYEHRAEIISFTIAEDDGLKAIKPAFKYYSKDWSIEDLTWIDDETIAIKVYDESGVPYKYFNAKFNW